jgi:hypothetical protein
MSQGRAEQRITDLERKSRKVQLNRYTVASVPAAADHADCLIVVTNESGGYTLAFSDGTNWRRVQDRAIIS